MNVDPIIIAVSGIHLESDSIQCVELFPGCICDNIYLNINEKKLLQRTLRCVTRLFCVIFIKRTTEDLKDEF